MGSNLRVCPSCGRQCKKIVVPPTKKMVYEGYNYSLRYWECSRHGEVSPMSKEQFETFKSGGYGALRRMMEKQ